MNCHKHALNKIICISDLYIKNKVCDLFLFVKLIIIYNK